ncbi:hypothetical protein [Bradymonas sediminis]|uniref:Uncharacterized protein n=1 Tax=Bradymonas sediminis TaxID=1548548 RepID=A0A2Z4FH32_9DELT|nr:hypothetical protein [Bradymonas sediminis]AWV88038.1 hypothetical protein DN745_01295 [Bradymonas sediminis]TDP77161.1 hypothetical protein DFR33_10157 [Bradymonas sediminis]
MKYTLTLCILAAAFLINPLWGCGDTAESDFSYDRQDMVEYSVGTWTGSLKLASGEQTDFELVITEPAAQTDAQGLELRKVKQSSCNQRQFSQRLGAYFVRPAFACVSSSNLAITAKLTTSDGSFRDQPLNGEMAVRSLHLSHASLSFALPDGGGLHAECDADKKCASGSFFTMEQNNRAQGEFVSMTKN